MCWPRHLPSIKPNLPDKLDREASQIIPHFWPWDRYQCRTTLVNNLPSSSTPSSVLGVSTITHPVGRPVPAPNSVVGCRSWTKSQALNLRAFSQKSCSRPSFTCFHLTSWSIPRTVHGLQQLEFLHFSRAFRHGQNKAPIQIHCALSAATNASLANSDAS